MKPRPVVWGALLGLSLSLACAEDLVIEEAVREINLQSQVAGLTWKLRVKNEGEQPVNTVDICLSAGHAGREAVFEAVQDASEGAPPLKLWPSNAGEGQGAKCASAVLTTPLVIGRSTEIQYAATVTQVLKPFPEAVFQNEPQRVLYHDSLYILSPYKVLKQSTKVKLPSKNLESFTKQQPYSQKGSVLDYGEYADAQPFSNATLRLHFENNTPFTVATSLVREVEVSHWGNVYIEEHYSIRHTGAKIRGEWSRLELMRDPARFGQAAVRGFVATLPPRAHSIYYKDVIGNISTSMVRQSLAATELILTPRYPLYGGWQVEFTLGFSLPLSDVVFKLPQNGGLRVSTLFGTPIAGVTVEHIENRVVLPEGSTVVNVEAPFPAELSRDKKYTYLDTGGRPVVVLTKSNIALQHNQPFVVDYTFSAISMLREPLLLVGVFLVIFAVCIAYGRCDFAITRDERWEAAQKAERTAFLVQEISTIVTERERQVSAASADPAQDVTALSHRLRHSEEQLKRRCLELEEVAGPKHSAKVRDLLEKERAVQAKVSQIAGLKSQLLQKGSSKQEAKAKLAEDLQDVADMQKQNAAKLESLS